MSMAVKLLRRSFTVAEYHRMVEAGILSERDRVELVEGEIVQMSPIGSRHAACVKRLIRLFDRGVGDRAIVGAQDPIRLAPAQTGATSAGWISTTAACRISVTASTRRVERSFRRSLPRTPARGPRITSTSIPSARNGWGS